jgi:NAD(P)-dependent dehydrogenase (short-subunit alcohol dehydrogenase family)
MKNFKDKVSVITGAGSGIGKALSLELAGRGARLAISDINADNVQATAADCEALGAEVHAYTLDVADREAFAVHAEEVLADFGSVNLVVNNAGVALNYDFVEMSWEDWDWLTGINFNGVVNGSKLFLPHLIASGDGYLVNISSVFGLVGVPGQSAYNAAKFAVRGLTESIAQEMLNAKLPVGVSSVHPGGIKTNIARAARGSNEVLAGRFENLARTTPAAAAKTIVKGVEANKLRILIGADAHLFEVMHRALGPHYTGIVRRGADRAQVV